MISVDKKKEKKWIAARVQPMYRWMKFPMQNASCYVETQTERNECEWKA